MWWKYCAASRLTSRARWPLVAAAAGTLAILELDAGAGGQHLQRLREVGALHLLDEVEEVAALAAAEAVPDLLLTADAKARRLLGMEGAEALVVPPGPL